MSINGPQIPASENSSRAATPPTHAVGAAQTASVAAGQPEGRQADIRYLDRADLAETFADSITNVIFDGQTLRIEFGVTRFDEVKPNAPISGRRLPACRLVLTPGAAVDLINRIQQTAAALKQAGVIKVPPPQVG